MLVQRREWAVAERVKPDVIEKLYRDLVQYFISEELQHWKKDFRSIKSFPGTLPMRSTSTCSIFRMPIFGSVF